MRVPFGKLDKGKTCLYTSIAQQVEHCADNAGVSGSSPLIRTIAQCADCKIKYMFVGIARQAFAYDACGEYPYEKSVGVPR